MGGPDQDLRARLVSEVVRVSAGCQPVEICGSPPLFAHWEGSGHLWNGCRCPVLISGLGVKCQVQPSRSTEVRRRPTCEPASLPISLGIHLHRSVIWLRRRFALDGGSTDWVRSHSDAASPYTSLPKERIGPIFVWRTCKERVRVWPFLFSQVPHQESRGYRPARRTRSSIRARLIHQGQLVPCEASTPRRAAW